MTRRLVVGLVVGLVVLLARLLGPTAARAEEEDLQAAVEVTIRYVDVVVTDRSGDPIDDLRVEDFELMEDGVPQEIVDFRLRDLEETAPPEDETAIDRRPHVVILFDVKHMSFGELDRPKRAARKLLDEILTPGTVASVMVLRHHLEVVAGPTTDHDALRAAVDEVLWWVPEEDLEVKLDELVLPEETDSDEGLSVSLYPRYASYGPDLSLFGVLEALGRSLKPVRGPKTVVLFSEGSPASVDEPRVAESYRRMIRALTQANVAVVTIDAEGLKGRVGRSDRLFRALPQINLAGREGKSSLKAVAKETGGRALIGSSNMDGFLDDTFQMRRRVYVLGYHPTATAGYREIEVDVKRRGARVIARRGVYQPGPSGGMSPELRLAALRESMASWVLPRDVAVRMANVAFPVSNREGIVAVVVEVGTDALTRQGWVAADIGGSMVEARSRNIHEWWIPLSFQVPDPAPRRVYALSLLRVPWGSYVSKTVVREGSRGRLGATEVRLEVPRLRKVGPLLSHLVLVDPGDSTPVIEMDAPPEASDLLMVDGRRVVPSLGHRFPRGRELIVHCSVWGLARGRSGGSQGALSLELKRGDTPVWRERVAIERTDERGGQLLLPIYVPLPLGELGPGDYELVGRITDRIEGAEYSRATPLSIE